MYGPFYDTMKAANCILIQHSVPHVCLLEALVICLSKGAIRGPRSELDQSVKTFNSELEHRRDTHSELEHIQ